MSVFPKQYADAVARLRVTSGFVLVLAFAWFSRPDSHSLIFGLPVSAVGLLLRAWATGHLEKNTRLTESGPYAYVRNPLYLGTLLVAAGFVIASQRWLLAGLFAAVFLLIYLPVIELEEQCHRYGQRCTRLNRSRAFNGAYMYTIASIRHYSDSWRGQPS